MFAVAYIIPLILGFIEGHRTTEDTPSEEKKVLLYTLSYGFSSHMLSFLHLSRVLQSRGHSVHLLVSSDGVGLVPQADIDAGINLRTYTAPNITKDMATEDYVRGLLSSTPDATTLEYIMSFVGIQKQYCESLLIDGLLKALKRNSFDVLIVDYTDNCGRIVSDFLHIPTIVYSPVGLSIDPAMFPTPLGLVAMPMSKFAIDNMPFVDRFLNTCLYLIAKVMWDPVWFGEFKSLRAHYKMNESLAIENAYLRTLVMVRADFCMDAPRPLMPNVVTIGDIISEPSRPLPSGILEKFISAAGSRGFIVVCFGTLVSKLDANRAEAVSRVLARLPQRVVWRHAGKRPQAVGNNTLLLDWIPQNDLLASNAKAFVSHCGLSSTFEAVRHGVPVIATPFAADGFVNARKLERLGMAIIVDWLNDNEESFDTRLRTALEHVTQQPRYRQKAQHAASLLADQIISPADKFAYYVEYISRHNGIDHLMSSSLSSMSTVQLYNVDIFAILILMAFTVAVFIVLSLYFIFVRIYRCAKQLSSTIHRKPKDTQELHLLFRLYCPVQEKRPNVLIKSWNYEYDTAFSH